MADIMVMHQTVEQAVADMQQATRMMDNALDNLLAGLSPLASTFEGQSATAWAEFQNAANQADANMQALFGQGAVILSDMHEIHKLADYRGSQVYQ
jgi:uncharacterized protein YukE